MGKKSKKKLKKNSQRNFIKQGGGSKAVYKLYKKTRKMVRDGFPYSALVKLAVHWLVPRLVAGWGECWSKHHPMYCNASPTLIVMQSIGIPSPAAFAAQQKCAALWAARVCAANHLHALSIFFRPEEAMRRCKPECTALASLAASVEQCAAARQQVWSSKGRKTL